MEDEGQTVKAHHWNTRTQERLFSLFAFALDQLYPPTCIHCHVPTARSGALCSDCWRMLRPITAPLCPILGLPFAMSMGDEARSAAALAAPPPYNRARSAVVYDEVARRIVSQLKYGDLPELAQFCARLMVGAAGELLAGDPVLVPVPLHRRRQWQRRYNQSTEIAGALAKLLSLEIAPTLVQRVRATRQQVGLNADQRRRNVSGAFAVSAEKTGSYLGRRLVLVDDVITTGATVSALTRSLNRVGFDQIDVISFARVVIGDDITI